MTEDWLYGVVNRLDGATRQKTSLNLDSACYYSTAYELAAWMPKFANSRADSDIEKTEGHITGFH